MVSRQSCTGGEDADWIVLKSREFAWEETSTQRRSHRKKRPATLTNCVDTPPKALHVEKEQVQDY